MPSSANRPAANSETPSKTMVALTIFNGLVLQHCPEHNTMHTARVVARESGEGCAPQSGDCHQFSPLELAGCTRFASRETLRPRAPAPDPPYVYVPQRTGDRK